MKHGRASLSLACCLTLCLSVGSAWISYPPVAQAGRILNDALVTQPFSHYIWQELLIRYVNADGAVDFTTLRAHPLRLNQYLDQLAAASPENKPEAFPTVSDRLAYWLNAHNALALRLILDAYPVNNLAEVTNFETNDRYVLGGRHYSLQAIKNNLAASGSDPMMLMFGLTHYTMDTPLVSRQAFEGQSLEKQLAAVRKQTLQDSAMVQYDAYSFITPDCQGFTLGSFFQASEPLFQAEHLLGAEDQDQDMNQDSANIGASPQSPQAWAKRLQKYAPPAYYAGLGKDCKHSIRFMAPNSTLRQPASI